MGHQIDDSYQATGESGGPIGFLNLRKHPELGIIRGAPTGAILCATKAGLKAMVGVEGINTPTLLDDQAGEGYGVGGASTVGDGVIGVSSSDSSQAQVSTPSGVLGIHTGDGVGVTGVTAGGVGIFGAFGQPAPAPTLSGVGVLGQSDITTGTGVSGVNTTPSAHHGNGAGVSGNSVGGYGGDFAGGLAPLHLKSGSTPGRPTDNSPQHQQGELYIDSNGTLFLCIASGVPGPNNWVQVVVQPAP